MQKKLFKNNLDYVVADSLSPVFGNLKFKLIIALNVLELIEPIDLLKHVSKQIPNGYFVISDPYDFDRGIHSVKKPFDESILRTKMEDFGFHILSKTKKPLRYAVELEIESTCTLNYKVDLIIGKNDIIILNQIFPYSCKFITWNC